MPLKSQSVNKPFTIGITGGIGSGKSIVSKIFSLLGVPVYNADDRAKWILSNNPEVKSGLINLFGDNAFIDGNLNRTFIAQEIFSNKRKVELMNALVHPRVRIDFQNWLEKNSGCDYIMKEAALLYEAGTYKELDKMITVFCPEDIRIRRVLGRDAHRKEEDVKNIIKNQLDENEKLKRADYIIYNDDEQMVIPQVLRLDAVFKGLV